MIEEPRNLGKNSITPDTLASLMSSEDQASKPAYLVIDCRFDYEYQGGHINNAINITDPEVMKDFFLKDRATIERLMQTVVIFHCEFSQKRGPTMY
jgi:M-phase inducer tyrosine phosphatase